MASDGRNGGKANFSGIVLSITVDNEAKADRMFEGLSDGGQVHDAAGQDVFLAAVWHGRR